MKVRTFVANYLKQLERVPELLGSPGGDQALTIEVELHLRGDAVREYVKERRRLERRGKL